MMKYRQKNKSFIHQCREDGGEKFRRHEMLLRNDVKDKPAAKTMEHPGLHLFIVLRRIQNHSLYTQSSAVVTCETSLRRRPSEIILFQRVELTCPKLFRNFFTGLLQLTNIFQHVHCRRNNFEIILELLQRLK